MAETFRQKIEYYQDKLRTYRLEKKAMIRVIESQRKELNDNIRNAPVIFFNWCKEKINKLIWRYINGR